MFHNLMSSNIAIVKTLAEYLDMTLQRLGMEDLTVLCHPPYACILRPVILQLRSEPRRISVSENNKQRFAYAYELNQITTGLDFIAVCCHSPISKNWDKLTPKGRERIFKALAGHACASTHNRALCRWIVGGDLNTKEGLLSKRAAEYWEPVIGSAAKDLGASHRPTITRSHRNSTCLHGDFAISQGILTTHVESTVGKSMQQHDQTYASDTHDLVLVHGWLADEPSSGVLPPAARPVEHIAGQDLLPSSGVFPPAASRWEPTESTIAQNPQAQQGQCEGKNTDPRDIVSVPSSSVFPPAGNHPEHHSENTPTVAKELLDDIQELSDVPLAATSGETLSDTASDVLSTIYQDNAGNLRSAFEVESNMQAILAIREQVIHKLAAPASQYYDHRWDAMAWKQWLGDNTLSHDQMTVALSHWQQVFEDTEMHKETHDRIMQFRAENTRESKESARKLSRGACRAFLQKRYGVPQLAKAFVKYPAVALHGLLQS